MLSRFSPESGKIPSGPATRTGGVIRAAMLGFVLSITGPQPEAFTVRLVTGWQNDRAYDACMARSGHDDWQCELILEQWPAGRPQEVLR